MNAKIFTKFMFPVSGFLIGLRTSDFRPRTLK